MAALPYITATGNIERALSGIRTAATPDRVSGDFVKTILGIKGGSGDQVTSYLKKIGFANPDGTPSDLYRRFRNPATTGQAAFEALKFGYGPLYARNEYMHKLRDEELRGLVIEETGQSEDSSVVSLVVSAIKQIKKFAKGDDSTPQLSLVSPPDQRSLQPLENPNQGVNVPKTRELGQAFGMNLSYTINLNLPATSDVAVFNAIFKSLKEKLLSNE